LPYSGKCLKTKQILCPAKRLHRFFFSPDFTDFHGF